MEQNTKALDKCWSCEIKIGGTYNLTQKIEQNLYAKEVKRVYILKGVRSCYNIKQVEICNWCCNLLDKEGFIVKQLSWNNVALLVKDGIIFVMTNNRFEKLIQHKSVEFFQDELMALIKA